MLDTCHIICLIFYQKWLNVNLWQMEEGGGGEKWNRLGKSSPKLMLYKVKTAINHIFSHISDLIFDMIRVYTTSDISMSIFWYKTLKPLLILKSWWLQDFWSYQLLVWKSPPYFWDLTMSILKLLLFLLF